MNGPRLLQSARPVLVAVGILTVLATVFWKLRILDRGVNPTIEVGPVDLYIEIIPTLEYGYSILKTGQFPLWNPYQLCGEPFFAIGWTGLLYPPHWIRFLTGILLSIEVLLVMHIVWAGLGMWLLARRAGADAIASLAAAMTFMWSGWITHNNVLPGVMESISWTPWLVLALEYVVQGRRLAWLWFTLALTAQLLLGLMEVTVHSLYVAALYFVCRLIPLAWSGEAGAAIRRGVLANVCIVAAVMLAAPLLLPTVELTQQSSRAAGQMTFAQAIGWGGAIPWPYFVREALAGVGQGTVGVLPLLAFPLALGLRRARALTIASGIAVVLAVLLVSGGTVFALYYRIPIIGSLFRRPLKFLDVYSFGQAMLAGLALAHLGELARLAPGALWRRPAWLGSLVLGFAGLLWLVHLGSWNWYLAALVGLLSLLGFAPGRRVRLATLVAICVLQGASLFFTVGGTHVRPIKRPEIFHQNDTLLGILQHNLGDARIYISPQLFFDPSLTAKQGQLRRMAVATDYEPLAVGRYATFFDRITTRTDPSPFFGTYSLRPESRWHLMRLSGAKYFVMAIDEPGAIHMQAHPNEFRTFATRGGVRIFERTAVLPRAYLVARSRRLPDDDAVLRALDDPAFDPRTEVLLEGDGAAAPAPVPPGTDLGTVVIASYEPEQVVLSVHANVASFVVLHDLYYPGWGATVDGRAVAIERADYLFRAIHMDAGTHEVRFTYHPNSFHTGLGLQALAALALGVAVIGSRLRLSALQRRAE